jgi:hypothetical protein
MTTRLVVAGEDSDGRAIFVSDSIVEPRRLHHLPGFELCQLWGGDGAPVLRAGGGQTPNPGAVTPPPGGFRFGFVTHPPDPSEAEVDAEGLAAELRESFPRMAETLDREHPGMHRTDTVDLDLVVSGEVWLQLADGAETLLRVGDCALVQGASHAWRNRSGEPCVVFTASLGALRAAQQQASS